MRKIIIESSMVARHYYFRVVKLFYPALCCKMLTFYQMKHGVLVMYPSLEIIHKNDGTTPSKEMKRRWHKFPMSFTQERRCHSKVG